MLRVFRRRLHLSAGSAATPPPTSPPPSLFYATDFAPAPDPNAHPQISKISSAARLGSQRIGLVGLPKELNHGVATLVAGQPKQVFIQESQRLYQYLRATALEVQQPNPSSASKKKKRPSLMSLPRKSLKQSMDLSPSTITEKPKKKKEEEDDEGDDEDGNEDFDDIMEGKPSYKVPSTAVAYAAGVMPFGYAATVRVLKETKARLGDAIRVRRIVDWGSGVGSGVWASHDIFGNSLEEYAGLELSQTMITLSNRLLHTAIPPSLPLSPPASLHSQSYPQPLLPPLSHLRTTFHKIDITLPSDGLRRISSPSAPTPANSTTSGVEGERIKDGESLALCAFTLLDLKDDECRRRMIREIWRSDASTIVIIERGTPRGFRVLSTARSQLLNYIADSPGSGHILAPCPHQLTCPLKKLNRVCNFAQRVSAPDYHRMSKGGEGRGVRTDEDVKFSYLVIRRGERPGNPNPSWESHVDKMGFEELVGEQGTLRQSGETTFAYGGSEESEGGLSDEELKKVGGLKREESLYWPRLVSPPLKRSGHVAMHVCSPSGYLEDQVIPKSQGKQAYYDARKSHWGDAFPHKPKGKSVPVIARNDSSTSGGVRPKIVVTRKDDDFGVGDEVSAERRAKIMVDGRNVREVNGEGTTRASRRQESRRKKKREIRRRERRKARDEMRVGATG